jgi:cytochrome P450
MLRHGAGNRDERQFDDPDASTVARKPARSSRSAWHPSLPALPPGES